ncbi:preprotein translocase subunit SecY [bacterium]|nr:preprotein translocase subunit SecY [bacterium]
MFETLGNIFKIKELRKRIFFTAFMLMIYRLGAHIPIPGINVEALKEFMVQFQGSLLGMIDLFSGGTFSQMTVFALGIMPYISASIILQLLTVVVPYLEKLSKEGEQGRKKITQYTRYGTVILSAIQAAGISWGLMNMSGGRPVVLNPSWRFMALTILTLTAGTSFIMWIGEQISDRGIGNGISLIIMAGIVARLPDAMIKTIQQLMTGEQQPLVIAIILVIIFVVTAGVVIMQLAERRIPIQYAKRVRGRKIYGGHSHHLPLKINTAGVIPVIFASSIIMFPAAIAKFIDVPFMVSFANNLSPGRLVHDILYILAIIFFCYFYTSIIFNPEDIAENLRKSGGTVPSYRAGKNTAEHINKVLSRVTLAGAIFLAAVSVLPQFLVSGIPVRDVPFIGEYLYNYFPNFLRHGFRVQFWFGGTALLIVVGVALDTVQQIESQLLMRHYSGFAKKGKIRGRRN